MLTLTPSAVLVIRALTVHHGIASEAGVLLYNNAAGTLAVRLAPWPGEADRVVEQSGVRVFVDADVARAVEDKSLDAMINDDGEVQFLLNDRPYAIARRSVTGPRRERRRPPRRTS